MCRDLITQWELRIARLGNRAAASFRIGITSAVFLLKERDVFHSLATTFPEPVSGITSGASFRCGSLFNSR
jgi:hypothetical protein